MSFKIHLKPSGHSFACEPQQSVLEAALKNGFAFPYGCRNGACGACMGELLEGEVEYPAGSYVNMTLARQDGRKALFCQAQPKTDLIIEIVEIGAAKDIQVKTLPVRVQSLEKLAQDVMCLRLRLPATQRMPFLAGQYIDFILKNGQRRSFSMANAPHDDELIELHVRHVPEGYFTGFVFEQLQEKSLLRIEGPHGSFCLNEESDQPIIMIAGGTGFAPIKSLMQHLIYTQSTRPVHLFWGARAKADLYLDKLASSWADQYANFSYTPVLSAEKPEDEWQGARGWVHDAVLEKLASDSLSAYEAYVCGPPPMVDAVKVSLLAAGLDEQSFFADAFEFQSNPG